MPQAQNKCCLAHVRVETADGIPRGPRSLAGFLQFSQSTCSLNINAFLFHLPAFKKSNCFKPTCRSGSIGMEIIVYSIFYPMMRYTFLVFILVSRSKPSVKSLSVFAVSRNACRRFQNMCSYFYNFIILLYCIFYTFVPYHRFSTSWIRCVT